MLNTHKNITNTHIKYKYFFYFLKKKMFSIKTCSNMDLLIKQLINHNEPNTVNNNDIVVSLSFVS